MKMFIVNNEEDALELKGFCDTLKKNEEVLLTALETIHPIDDNEQYKEVLNTFNTTFTIRTAVEDGINLLHSTVSE